MHAGTQEKKHQKMTQDTEGEDRARDGERHTEKRELELERDTYSEMCRQGRRPLQTEVKTERTGGI